VQALFAAHGDVSTVSLVIDRESGLPRGFGFVEMSNNGAVMAMQALDGRAFDGRAMKVCEADDHGQLRGTLANRYGS
jgi:RNA recognition motif-containing protein